MTGGVGREKLSYFYANHFIFKNPADAELEVISRTVGIDRVVDEFIYKITHDCEVDWLYVPFFYLVSFILIIPNTVFPVFHQRAKNSKSQ